MPTPLLNNNRASLALPRCHLDALQDFHRPVDSLHLLCSLLGLLGWPEIEMAAPGGCAVRVAEPVALPVLQVVLHLLQGIALLKWRQLHAEDGLGFLHGHLAHPYPRLTSNHAMVLDLLGAGYLGLVSVFMAPFTTRRPREDAAPTTAVQTSMTETFL